MNQINAVLFILITISLVISTICFAVDVHTDRTGTIGIMDESAPGPRGRGRDRDTRQNRDRQATDAMREVSDMTRDILSIANNGEWPSEQKIGEAEELIMKNRRYVKDVDDKEQSDYFTLAAWVEYYRGDKKTAFQSAAKAHRTDIENGDAKLTYTAMAIINGQPLRYFDERPQRQQRRNNRNNMPGPGGFGDPMMGSRHSQPRITTTGKNLKFDLADLKEDIIGKKVGPMDLKCVNSTEFSYNPSKSVLCLFLWQLEDKNTPSETVDEDPADPCDVRQNESRDRSRGGFNDPFGMPGGPGMGMGMHSGSQKKTNADIDKQADAFANWFRVSVFNPEIKFLGLNLDSPVKKQTVFDSLAQSTWTWAQAMADEGNKPVVSELANVDFEGPGAAMAIVDKQGNIRYAGPAEGFLPAMVLEDLILSPKVAEEDTGQASPFGMPGAEPPAAKKAETKKSAASENPNPGMSEADKYRASQLIETARGYVKAGRFTGFKFAVDMCREVLEKWPESTYAKEARELLNRIPKRYHSRYGITNEELGR